MEIIDKIKKDAEKKGIVIPKVEKDYIFTSTRGNELRGMFKIEKTSSLEETISSVDALNYVLKDKYGEEFANRVLKRVYDRAQPFVSTNSSVDLIANANKKAMSLNESNIELLTMLNRKNVSGALLPDEAPYKKINVNVSSRNYRGAKCCYVPKMCMSSLAGRERKYIAIDLKPVTALELKDFISELEMSIEENKSKYSADEYSTKMVQAETLALLLSDYQTDKNEMDGGISEMKIYEILASLIETEVLPRPKRLFVSQPESEKLEPPAEKDNEIINEIVDHSNKVLRVFFEKGQNPTILPNFAGSYVDILGHTGFTEEEITNERQ